MGRIYGQQVWTYLVSSAIVWFCSWLLLFVSTSIPPAIAGGVIAQVVLVMITVSSLTAVMRELPPMSEVVYASSTITGALFLQLLLLLFHLVRMSAVAGKMAATTEFLTVCAKIFFLCAFFWVQGIVIWSYFGMGPAMAKVTIVLGAVFFVVFIAMLCLKHRILKGAHLAEIRQSPSLWAEVKQGLDLLLGRSDQPDGLSTGPFADGYDQSERATAAPVPTEAASQRDAGHMVEEVASF